MKNRVQIALVGTLLSILAHVYLTLHYYPLKFGFAGGQSLCNINQKFDCDAVSASSFSALFGIPLSVWGAVFNAVLFIMILLAWLEWSEYPERLRRWSLAFAGVSLASSLVMGAISLTMMQAYCLFCIGLYILSAIVFVALKGTLREPFLMHFKMDLPKLWSDSRGIVFTMIAIPAAAYLTHQMFMQNLGDAQLTRVVNESVADWQAAPVQNFVAKPALVMGPSAENAKLRLVEFADFNCGHCKRASYTLHAFVKAHPDVRFEFYNFPLDGACNEKITGSNGMSCRMASAVLCAEAEGKGWDMHHLLFEKQEQYIRLGSPNELDVELAKEVVPMGLNWESVLRCLNQPETMDAVRAQAKQGALVDVRGTPTLFANGKLLQRGQLVPVLQAVHAKASQ
ncbi:MAG TPA: vitamin K epoxide reductase family protein [Bdellovibrionales bacterium]|nr:vitamin K epoxide reductase family protein [Bdellovibrionales bacterium]